jgi:hypothetical protein
MPPRKSIGNTKGPFIPPARTGPLSPRNIEEEPSEVTVKRTKLPMNPELAAMLDLSGGKKKQKEKEKTNAKTKVTPKSKVK